MGQSPAGAHCNRGGDGWPLLNGPTEFGLRHPVAAQWTTRPSKRAQAGDVLFCVRGSTTGKMNVADQQYAIGRGIAAIRSTDPDLTRFVQYALRWRLDTLLSRATGSTFPNLSRESITGLDVPNPPAAEQRRIVATLGALEDLVYANQKTIGRLWSSAHALFERCQSGSTKQVVLGEVIELRYGKALPSNTRRHGVVPVVSSAGISGTHDTPIVSGPGVVVGRKGSVGSVTWVDRDFYPIDTAFYVEAQAVPVQWAYFTLKSLPLTSMNTDSAVPGLNRSNALALRVKVPSERALQDFGRRASVLLQTVSALEAENEGLERTAAALLPQLMAGRISVRTKALPL